MVSHPPSRDTYDVDALRAEEFPWADRTLYLNHASIGPLPTRTVRVLDALSQRRANPATLPDSDLFEILSESRRLAAALIGAPPSAVALAPNTSYGLTLAAGGLPLEPGDIVVASDREFPANVYPWMRLKSRGIHFELQPTTPEGWPDIARLLDRVRDPRVRVLAISLVQFSSGYCADLARLSKATRDANTFLVVDAIQALGQIPVDVGETPVDILSAGGQKWLLSPWGSGFVYVRPELLQVLDPPVVGWLAFRGSQDFTRLTDYDDQPLPDARRLELATLPFQDFAGMNASLSLLLSLGIGGIRRHLDTVLEPVREWSRRRGVPLVSPSGQHGSGILCLAPADPARVHRALAAVGVVASRREGTVRLSPHCYTTLAEMERVTAVLDDVC